MSDPPRVRVIATGGTIAMTGSPARPARAAAELVAAVPELAGIAAVDVTDLGNVPGAHLSPAAMAEAIAAASEAVEAGDTGAVVLQGTDTIEESADLADLVWAADAPLVYTGAIRPGGSSGSDGPLNLHDAVVLAASPAARSAGALVVFGGLVAAGSDVFKASSWESAAFASPLPLGHVREGIVDVRPRSGRRPPVASPGDLAEADLSAFVPIVGLAAGSDGREIEAVLAAGARALVVTSLGAGHVPAAALAAIDRAVAAVPVAVCAGTATGPTLTRTYGFEGSETDLAARGALLAGAATPRKARIRLVAALGLGLDPTAVLA